MCSLDDAEDCARQKAKKKTRSTDDTVAVVSWCKLYADKAKAKAYATRRARHDQQIESERVDKYQQ